MVDEVVQRLREYHQAASEMSEVCSTNQSDEDYPHTIIGDAIEEFRQLSYHQTEASTVTSGITVPACLVIP